MLETLETDSNKLNRLAEVVATRNSTSLVFKQAWFRGFPTWRNLPMIPFTFLGKVLRIWPQHTLMALTHRFHKRPAALSCNGSHLRRLLTDAVIGHLGRAAQTKLGSGHWAPWIRNQGTVLKGWNATRIGSLHSCQPFRCAATGLWGQCLPLCGPTTWNCMESGGAPWRGPRTNFTLRSAQWPRHSKVKDS